MSTDDTKGAREPKDERQGGVEKPGTEGTDLKNMQGTANPEPRHPDDQDAEGNVGLPDHGGVPKTKAFDIRGDGDKLADEEAEKDPNFANQAAETAAESGSAPTLSGNAMPAGPHDPNVVFEKQFGMAQDVHDPHRGDVPEGQLNSAPLKVAPIDNPLTSVQTNPADPLPKPNARPLKYRVVIQPATQTTKDPVVFRSGQEFASIVPGEETSVTEAIYHAIKDSDITYQAAPIVEPGKVDVD